MKFKFGDLIENGWASTDNPRRIGIYVKIANGHYEMTDGKGSFWLNAKDNERLVKIGSILNGRPDVDSITAHDDALQRVLGEMQRRQSI